jgi:hypothetical protein
MTYAEITEALHARKCVSTVAALDYAVELEKTSLHENTTKYKLRDGGHAARAAARDFYAEDITHLLGDPQQPTPERVLNSRRFAVAWAVAEVLRTT